MPSQVLGTFAGIVYVMEKKVETTIVYGLYRDDIRVI